MSKVIQRQLKLKLTKVQEHTVNTWINNLTGVWNWAVRQIELNAANKIYFNPRYFENLLSGHSKKLGIPSHVLQGILSDVYLSWKRCFKGLAKKPHLKGKRNALNSIPFPDPIQEPKNNYVKLPILGTLKFHKQNIPQGKIKCGRIIKKSESWYLCLVIDTTPNIIPIVSNNKVGIDPGFISLLTLSTGEKIPHPKELQKSLKRLAQAQKGHDKKLASRLNKKISNQRKDRNHKLSRRLVSQNELICLSKDNLKGLAKKFGKSVASSAIGELRQMLSYKSSSCGRKYVEVESKNSTRTCSNCQALTGPTGWAGLKVRSWVCKNCGSSHDRDTNAAINTLKIGSGIDLESVAKTTRLESNEKSLDIHEKLFSEQ